MYSRHIVTFISLLCQIFHFLLNFLELGFASGNSVLIMTQCCNSVFPIWYSHTSVIYIFMFFYCWFSWWWRFI